MKILVRFICSLSLLVFSHATLAYKEPTHEDMSEAAAFSSILKQPEIFTTLGLKGGLDDINLKLPNSEGKEKTIKLIIRDGANFEDSNIRPLNHFFDPLNDIGGKGEKSPDWALKDTASISAQEYSYRDARNYLFKALTQSADEERKKNFGLTFQTLGQVIHHIQDMAQPQHVRLDDHCDAFVCRLIGKYNPSRYEDYTDKKRELKTLPYSGYAPIYAGTDTATFTTPRKFWTTTIGAGNGGKGIAEYTNRGFFSAGTNMGSGRYVSPNIDPNAGVDIDIAVLCEETKNKNPCPPEILALAGNKITFFSNEVTDTLRPAASKRNLMATTSSIFDQDLKKLGNAPVYALNRFNFDAAHEFLIPRAVAYSAGLIDYFFRGKIDLISNPDSTGSYRIKNLGNEDMSGTFALYYDGADGVRHPVPGASWNLQIAKNGQSTPFVFYAPVAPAPKTAGEYMLVFNGDMGEEAAGNEFVGAVTGKMVRAQPSTSGFIFQPGSKLPDGISGNRLIYQDNGQWILSKEPGLVAGNIDWRGWYVNGKPTKVITWKGPASRYFPTSDETLGYFSKEIYQDGKLFSVAPAPVLGAALTRDASGKEWLIAICQTAAGDTVYRRPNTVNTAPSLYDPVQTPEGWQHVATFPSPQNTLRANRPWLFNGNGTEAQTMRCGEVDQNWPWSCTGLTLTRLKMTINGTSANMVDLGNTVITESRSWTRSANCGRPATTSYGKGTSTTTGATVVAVDYRDNQEILAKVIVNDSSSDEESGEGGGSPGNKVQMKLASDSKRSRKLSFSGMEIILNNSQSSKTASYINASANGFASTSAYTTEKSEILFLDLRDSLAIYRQPSMQGNSSSAGPSGGRAPWSSTSARGSKYQLRHGATIQTFYSYSDNLTDSGVDLDYLDQFSSMRGCLDGEGDDRSEADSTTKEYKEELFISSKDANAATDREGNLFVSMKYLDEKEVVRYFNFLSGGDPVAVTGIAGATPLFYGIAPK